MWLVQTHIGLTDLNCSEWLPKALGFLDFTAGAAGTGAFLWLLELQVLINDGLLQE